MIGPHVDLSSNFDNHNQDSSGSDNMLLTADVIEGDLLAIFCAKIKPPTDYLLLWHFKWHYFKGIWSISTP